MTQGQKQKMKEKDFCHSTPKPTNPLLPQPSQHPSAHNSVHITPHTDRNSLNQPQVVLKERLTTAAFELDGSSGQSHGAAAPSVFNSGDCRTLPPNCEDGVSSSLTRVQDTASQAATEHGENSHQLRSTAQITGTNLVIGTLTDGTRDLSDHRVSLLANQSHLPLTSPSALLEPKRLAVSDVSEFSASVKHSPSEKRHGAIFQNHITKREMVEQGVSQLCLTCGEEHLFKGCLLGTQTHTSPSLGSSNSFLIHSPEPELFNLLENGLSSSKHLQPITSSNQANSPFLGPLNNPNHNTFSSQPNPTTLSKKPTAHKSTQHLTHPNPLQPQNGPIKNNTIFSKTTQPKPNAPLKLKKLFITQPIKDTKPLPNQLALTPTNSPPRKCHAQQPIGHPTPCTKFCRAEPTPGQPITAHHACIKPQTNSLTSLNTPSPPQTHLTPTPQPKPKPSTKPTNPYHKQPKTTPQHPAQPRVPSLPRENPITSLNQVASPPQIQANRAQTFTANSTEPHRLDTCTSHNTPGSLNQDRGAQTNLDHAPDLARQLSPLRLTQGTAAHTTETIHCQPHPIQSTCHFVPELNTINPPESLKINCMLNQQPQVELDSVSLKNSLVKVSIFQWRKLMGHLRRPKWRTNWPPSSLRPNTQSTPSI